MHYPPRPEDLLSKAEYTAQVAAFSLTLARPLPLPGRASGFISYFMQFKTRETVGVIVLKMEWVHPCWCAGAGGAATVGAAGRQLPEIAKEGCGWQLAGVAYVYLGYIIQVR
jgi:hypothetical protein